MGDIKRYVWISIAVGIGLLAVFIATLIIVNGIAVTRRRRQAEQLFADLVKAQADERQRIIGALHDDIGQSLYRIHYGLEDSRGRVDPDDPLAGELARLDDIVLEVDESLRQELRTLHHGSVEEIGLGAALDELAEITEAESDLTVDVDVIHDCTLTSTGRVALYRAAREAVTNARKHALATAVDVRVERRHDRVQVQVLDDGIGFDGDEGLGLTTTRERLEAIGGGLRVGTARQGGTRVRAWVPAGQCGGHQ